MALVVAGPACQHKAAPTPTAAAACPATAEQTGAIAWYVDDLPKAQVCAKAKRLPLVVDLWAPWCHTCLSMKHFVFPDPSLAPLASRFVFASIDTDKPSNAAAVAALPITSWPTFYVVAPEDLAVQARFVGSATIAQLRNFLSDGERGYVARSKVLAPGSSDALLRDGERALAKGDATGGNALLLSALQKATTDWPRRNDVLVELIQGHEKANDLVGCLSIAGLYMGEIGKVASRTDFLSFALECATEFENQKLPTVDGIISVRALREAAAASLRELLADKDAPLSVDDRSDAMANLRDTLDALGKKDEAHAIAEQQRALLDAAAAAAPDPLAAMTYNWPRSDVYAYLGVPLELVPALEKSAADLPDEYDPPARLQWILQKAGKPDEAAAWGEKAAAKAYGPRLARVLGQLADSYEAAKQPSKELEALNRQLALLKTLPPNEIAPDAIDKVTTRITTLTAQK